MFKKAVAAGIMIISLIAGCTSTEKNVASTSAPDFTLPDLSGKKVRLSDQKGKVVLLEFWATWCPPCRASIPVIERLHKAYGGKGLAILAVSLDEGGWDAVRAFSAENGITYPVLRGDDDVSSKYMVRLIPTMFLLDRRGNIAKQYMGGGNDEVIEQEVRALLERSGAASGPSLISG